MPGFLPLILSQKQISLYHSGFSYPTVETSNFYAERRENLGRLGSLA